MKKKKVVLFGAALVAIAGLSCFSSALKNELVSQNMAERWESDETRYSQVSVFMQPGSELSGANDALKLREYIDTKLKSESYTPVNEGAKVWIDAYSSCMSTANASVYDVESGKTDFCSSDINIIGTGGEFFDFHPLELISGNYIYSDELKNSRAVLDEEAAWIIFNSSDIVGMKFTVGGKEFEVAGVVKAEDSKAVKVAYPKSPVVYIHYDALEEAGLDTSLLCYESVIPNPVSNYAKNIFLEYYGIDTMNVQDDIQSAEEKISSVIVDNTNRYKASELFNNLKSFGKNQVVSKPIAFPYWENSARVNEAWLTAVFFIILLLAAYILITVIIFTAKLYLNRKWHLKDYIEKLTDKYTYKKKISDYIDVETNVNSEREKKYE